ncbi:glycoside hydrolase family 38 C-terminal domain-containing protein [Alteribacter keqinensis]|uniref:Alpha-mannosidase n=1 Tax=Alteribacter keqinensis TaxID=2483800 RepID=A0A3M7TRT5_9BACI|nr:glycoside hydrolase family 38 C-terminal domain-containing protein [Alteribacter keqinensis]RNA67909.1 alpha-mannosidase [Alteribacter keqinensis]
MSSKKQTVFVVPHSHWDREWYFTIEDSNVLLIENMDYLLNVLDEDPEYHAYMFDGQASVIDEYIARRPNEKERVSRLVKEKRLFIGPWYTQTDSLLVNKESMIRNLLYGTRIAEDYGHNMNIGYLPDIFGQNAYLPSIFRGFGLDYSILQRGVYTDELKGSMNFHWTSPDGESVKTNNMYYGYGPGKFLSDEDDYFNERLVPILEKLSDLNDGTSNVLLPSGGDQVLVRRHFPETVRRLNEKDPEREYVLSDYESFMEAAWSDENAFENHIKGELIASQKSRIHNTIRSQRYDIKQLNYRVENKLLTILEPLSVIGKSLGLSYPQAWMDEMWKKLFDVHAHDSIGGCNSDDTNNDIMVRLEKVERICDGLINLKKKQITEAVSCEIGRDNLLTVFNFTPAAAEKAAESVIFTREKVFSVKTRDGDVIPAELTSQSYISGGTKIVVTAEGEKQVEEPGYYRSEVTLTNTKIPAIGYQTFIIEEENGDLGLKEPANKEQIENDNLLITFKNGRLTLTDKRSGKQIENLLTFENRADAGDSYDYSPLENDEPYWLTEGTLTDVESGPHSQTMTVTHARSVPANLEERKTKEETALLSISTTLTLCEGESYVRIVHRINNQIKDHRVRVNLATGADNPSHSFADQGFSLIERPVQNPHFSNWKEKGYAEAPVSIYPLENFAGVANGNGMAAVITKGLKEYQVTEEDSALSLTLFRSVGLLGRDDLAWRPGRASGINNKVVYTPDAQMQQDLTFEYAYVFESETHDPNTLFSLADEYTKRYDTYQKQSLNTFEERLERFEIPYPLTGIAPEYSLFSFTNEKVKMSMCKLGHDQDGVMVRLFNPTDQPLQTTCEDFQGELIVCDLNEKEQKKVTGRSIDVPARGYVTVKMMLFS